MATLTTDQIKARVIKHANADAAFRAALIADPLPTIEAYIG